MRMGCVRSTLGRMTLSPVRALSGILLATVALAVAPSSASAVAAYEGFESPNVGGLGNFRASTPGSWAHEFGTSHTGSSSASAAEPSAMSDERLTHESSYAVSPDAVAPRLSFWHRFQ